MDGATESDYDSYSTAIPIGGTVTAESNGDSATYQFNWEVSGSGDLLLFALPHHMDSLALNPDFSVSYIVFNLDLLLLTFYSL